MNEVSFKRRGWLCAAIAPVACVLFLLGQRAGFWEGGSPVFTALAAILMVEMLVGTVAPFWWLLTYYRRRRQLRDNMAVILGANLFALAVSLFFFF